eukprot:TRINITY_DN1750_c0_g1_i3.p1 TRINITY_DN1750_c0_g1~~TRINITY_DN1750_c0_g1_i3.p1  ORF type:complete len:536 (+),score=90.79 TRINITY_DN1750_c0_g1_i3:80-1609(+)
MGAGRYSVSSVRPSLLLAMHALLQTVAGDYQLWQDVSLVQIPKKPPAEMSAGAVYNERDILTRALRIGSGGRVPKTRAEVIDALNNASQMQTVEEAVHNKDVITEDTLRLAVGEPSYGCLKRNPGLCHEGDMLAVDEMQLESFRNVSSVHNRTRSIAAGKAWDNNHIRYCFAADVSGHARLLWQAAVDQYKRALPCLTFTDVGNPGLHSSTSADDQKECDGGSSAIFVQSDMSGCWSFIGQLPRGFWFNGKAMKAQLLNLQPNGCEFLGIVIHELGHALGMAHEQSRPDRDAFVNVHWENIRQGMMRNFDIDPNSYVAETYDYTSIMHYGTHSMSSNGMATITTPGNANDHVIGQRMGLSNYDARQLAAMYHDCQAGSLSGNMGCSDHDAARCATLSSCSSSRDVSECCACGGGIQYRCWSSSECSQPAPLPHSDHSACIADLTDDPFGGAYPCVTSQGCDYTVRIKCDVAPGYIWDYTPRGCCQLPPWGTAICEALKSPTPGCTFDRV